MKEVSAPGGLLTFALSLFPTVTCRATWMEGQGPHALRCRAASLTPQLGHSFVSYPVVSPRAQAKPVSCCGIQRTKASWEWPTPENGFSSLSSYEVEGFSSHILANLLNLKQNAIKAFTFFP